ncbi:hypothetical protein HanRHA438_Chr04g0176761 [Helianthus annuus]|nr:hypothetical protein HanHA300_Chr04g0137111 [Helianthus annuus]KAJ0588890.1 hypothetical protein HanIR_Chr04g0179911 [Helianthus annuus]KAJ0597049.1 hypothetical protein HanHA89_Chr04g0150071 [Helianthus annuus]KAJ0926912.1 hypothetical protein HanRHA438_Chr04g0176761 [Helianthus annuus]
MDTFLLLNLCFHFLDTPSSFIIQGESCDINEQFETTHPHIFHILLDVCYVLHSFKSNKAKLETVFVPFPRYIHSFDRPENS